MNIEICFQKRINLIFSLLIEGDNIVFSPLCYENNFQKYARKTKPYTQNFRGSS